MRYFDFEYLSRKYKLDMCRKQYIKYFILNGAFCFILLLMILADVISIQEKGKCLVMTRSYYWTAYNLVFLSLGALSYIYSKKYWLNMYIEAIIPVSTLPVIFLCAVTDVHILSRLEKCLQFEVTFTIDILVLLWAFAGLIYYILQFLLYYHGSIFMTAMNITPTEKILFRAIGADWTPNDYI